MDDDGITESGLSALCSSLQASWADFSAAIPTGDRHPAQVFCVMTLAAHTHRLATAAVRLLAADAVLESVPTVRAAFESAIRGIYIAQVPDAAARLTKDSIRQRNTMLTEAARQPWAAERGIGPTMNCDGPLYADVPSRTSMESVFRALTPNMYLTYRMLSEYAHPGAGVMDEYALLRDEPPGFSVRKVPRAEHANLSWWATAVALTYAGRSVDYLDPHRTRRSELRAAARYLQVPKSLKPTS